MSAGGGDEPHWWSPRARGRRREILDAVFAAGGTPSPARLVDVVEDAARRSRHIHEVRCVNLNPATNVMNPRAEALLAAGLGTRASLGHPGEKYETGLEAIEEIEVVTAELACRVFGARHAEIRVGSGALANLYAFMATCEPGDPVIVPPDTIAGHVTHNRAGAAGLYGLEIHEAPVDPRRYTVDLDALTDLARRVRPRLITIGGSLNLFPHPVAEVRTIADEVGARLLYDAAHTSGMLAGGVWPNPLHEGADLVTCSTYKSLAGPPGGLVLTDDAELAARVDAIAYPGLTANFDVSVTAALAVTLAGWLHDGSAYARAMADTAVRLADELERRGIGVHVPDPDDGRPTTSHQFAVRAERWGGGQAASRRLRQANLLACGIGLPVPVEPGRLEPGDLPGLRLGTPEIVRWGMGPADMDVLAGFLARALDGDPSTVADEVTAWRARFDTVGFLGA